MESSIEDFDVGLDVETENEDDEEWSGPDLKFVNLEGNRIIEFEPQGYFENFCRGYSTILFQSQPASENLAKKDTLL